MEDKLITTDPSTIYGVEMTVDSYEPELYATKGSARRIRFGNNRYHVPRAQAKAKRKARKQAQKAQRRR